MLQRHVDRCHLSPYVRRHALRCEGRPCVGRALLYEEEDFQPSSLPERTGVTPLRAVGMLREAEEDLTRELRGRKRNGTDSGAPAQVRCPRTAAPRSGRLPAPSYGVPELPRCVGKCRCDCGAAVPIDCVESSGHLTELGCDW